MQTDIAVIGGGPAGLLLSRLLGRAGIDTVILERATRAHVLARIRAGVLEEGLVDLCERAGIADRLHAGRQLHHGTVIAHGEDRLRIDFAAHGGRAVTVYGQTELTRDLYAARDASGSRTLHGVGDVRLEGLDTDTPAVRFRHGGAEHRLTARAVAGCDGFHGVSRRAIPEAVRTEYERVYPFGWLGIVAETPPVHHELIYANSPRGFALCSMRPPDRSRYYIQCPLTDRPEDWSDAAFWDELRRRLPAGDAGRLVTGPSVEKSIAPLRSFVSEPMRWGRLFLAGDAAHIVPPTGAKGLNTAASDVHYLSRALIAWLTDGETGGIDTYSQTALARVWKVQRFSWWMTTLLHRFPDQSPFDLRMQAAEFAHLRESPAAQAALAQNYVGLPY